MKSIVLAVALTLSGFVVGQEVHPDTYMAEEWYAKMKREHSPENMRKESQEYLESIEELDTSLFELEIFNEINRQRALNRKPAFKHGNQVQYDSTRLWARIQADGGFCGHDPAYMSADMWTEVSAQNCFVKGWIYKGKEKELTVDIAKKLVAQWMNSPGHKRSIMSTDYSIMSVGVGFKPVDGVMLIYTTARGHK